MRSITTHRLNWLIGLVVSAAVACGAVSAAMLFAPPPDWTVAGLVVGVTVAGYHLQVTYRVGGQRLILVWCQAASAVALVLEPGPWMVLTVATAWTVTTFGPGGLRPVKALYNTALNTVAAGTAATVYHLGEPWVIAEGWDFYSFPRPSPDGRWLAWTCWRHPLMPWDGCWLWGARLGGDGRLADPWVVAGGFGESVFQPEWSPDGVLHFVSDRSGWWSLHALAGDRPTLVADLVGAELGVAQWEFGYSTYAFLDSGELAFLARRHFGAVRSAVGPGAAADPVALHRDQALPRRGRAERRTHRSQ